MQPTNFYTLSGQPIYLKQNKRGQVDILQIFGMGYNDWQTTPGGNCIILTREQTINIANQINPDGSGIRHDQRDLRKAIILAEAAKYGIK